MARKEYITPMIVSEAVDPPGYVAAAVIVIAVIIAVQAWVAYAERGGSYRRDC